jgi:hypothetical protein
MPVTTGSVPWLLLPGADNQHAKNLDVNGFVVIETPTSRLAGSWDGFRGTAAWFLAVCWFCFSGKHEAKRWVASVPQSDRLIGASEVEGIVGTFLIAGFI